jgi:hypothetical protein
MSTEKKVSATKIAQRWCLAKWIVSLIAASGCSGPSGGGNASGAFSCEITSGPARGCNEYTWTGGAYETATWSQACTQSGGSAGNSCPRSGAVGGCEHTSRSGAITIITTNWFYMGQAAAYQSACELSGGTFVAGEGGGASDGGGGGGLIPKPGPPYGGIHKDPGLTTHGQCPDNSPALEPNDSPAQSVDLVGSSLTPVPDTSPGKVTALAICPKGSGDLDYLKVDTSLLSASPLTLMAEIFYDVSYGDLDVAILDEAGKLVSFDSSALSNGCTSARLDPGVYYVLVAGAGSDVNRYDLQVRTFSGSRSCP